MKKSIFVFYLSYSCYLFFESSDLSLVFIFPERLLPVAVQDEDRLSSCSPGLPRLVHRQDLSSDFDFCSAFAVPVGFVPAA
jgi:hypothetical protein